MFKDKIHNLKDMEFYSAFTMASAIVNKWIKAKPDNKELKQLSQSLVDIFFWSNNMEQELRLHKHAMSEYLEDKNNAILEKRKCEKQIKKLQKDLEKFKKLTNL